MSSAPGKAQAAQVLQEEIVPALRTAARMYAMDREVIAAEARTEKPTRAAWIIFAFGTVALGIGAFWSPLGLILVPLSAYASVWVMDRVAQSLGGQARLPTLMHCYGLLCAVNLIALVPRVGVFFALLTTLWGFVVLATVVQEVYELPAERAIKCVLAMVVTTILTMGVLSMAVSTFQVRAAREDAQQQRVNPLEE